MKARLKRIEKRIRNNQKPFFRFYTDESGCFYDKSPFSIGAQQVSREQVQALINDTGTLVFVVRYEPPEPDDDWSRILDG